MDKEKNRAYYLANQDRIKEKSKIHRDNNKDYYAKYYQNNKEKSAEYYRQYYIDNKEKILKNKKDYQKEQPICPTYIGIYRMKYCPFCGKEIKFNKV